MKDFKDKIAVITGGGTGIGRALARHLSAQGCHVAICGQTTDSLDESKSLCLQGAPSGTKIMAFTADVSKEAQLQAFCEAVKEEFDTNHINLLINNAGIGGDLSFVTGGRDQWERTFNVNWNGVYYSTRTFIPLLINADEGCIVNVSSVNGLWGCVGPTRPISAYSASKFAVKGFTEALMVDLRLNAPHIKCVLVIPGYIATEMYRNSRRSYRAIGDLQLTRPEQKQLRKFLQAKGKQETDTPTKADLDEFLEHQAVNFVKNAPMTADEAATIILDGIVQEKWRILVGKDAEKIDRMVRDRPEEAYGSEFFNELIGR